MMASGMLIACTGYVWLERWICDHGIMALMKAKTKFYLIRSHLLVSWSVSVVRESVSIAARLTRTINDFPWSIWHQVGQVGDRVIVSHLPLFVMIDAKIKTKIPMSEVSTLFVSVKTCLFGTVEARTSLDGPGAGVSQSRSKLVCYHLEHRRTFVLFTYSECSA